MQIAKGYFYVPILERVECRVHKKNCSLSLKSNVHIWFAKENALQRYRDIYYAKYYGRVGG